MSSNNNYTSVTGYPAIMGVTGGGGGGSVSVGYTQPYTSTNSGGYTTNFDKLSVSTLFINGKDLGKVLDTIDSRLCILEADEQKLAQFKALKKAYDNYKTIEKLCSP